MSLRRERVAERGDCRAGMRLPGGRVKGSLVSAVRL